MKTPEHWAELVKASESPEATVKIVRQIQADALKAAGEFAFTEREFAMADKLGAAAEALLH